jgi:hypothetical protein
MSRYDLHFDLTRLSDRVLAMFIRNLAEVKKPHPVQDVIGGLLAQELGRRALGQEFPLREAAFPTFTVDQLREAYRHLTVDVASLETAAVLAGAQGEEREQAELLVGAEFLTAVADSLLLPQEGGIH